MVKDHEAFDYQASPNSLHEQKVNDLIPWAVNHANECVKNTGDLQKHRAAWSSCYLAKMNQMAISDGLRIELT